MAASLSSFLRDLPAEDFAILVQRRVNPDAVRAGRGPRDLAGLAEVLARPYGIHEAVASLDLWIP